MRAAKNGHLACVQLLHAYDRHCINRLNRAKDASPLILAAQNGHLYVVRELLSRGAAPGQRLKDGTNAIMDAARCGHAEVLRLLMTWPYPDGMVLPGEPQPANGMDMP